jgi:HEAT repeat protein
MVIAMTSKTKLLTAARKLKRLFSLVARPAYALLLVLTAHAGAMMAQTPQQQAWDILRAGVNEKSTGKRTQAIRALRLLPGDTEAEGMAEAALQDRKPEVRADAATAIGLMGSKAAIPGLKKALSDRKPAVALAAAHALQVLNDPAGYQVYYEVLTGERKSTEGLVDQQMETLKDRKKMAELGFEEGLAFVPFVDIGYSAAKEMLKDNASSVRAAAARSLVNDSDLRIGQALVRAASDKSWMVRASALLAIAKRGDPKLLDAVVPALSDKNGVVRNTAAVAVIRLTTVADLDKGVKATSNGKVDTPNRNEQEAESQTAMVWTNDDLEKLHSHHMISIVGRIDQESPTPPPAPRPYVRTQDPDWYAAQSAKLRDELERRQTQLSEYRQAIDDARSLRKTTGGVNLDESDIAITPEGGIEILEWNVDQVQTQINELEDLARRHDIPPGTLRGQ